MADLSSSQQPQTFHLDFEQDVFMTVLSVCDSDIISLLLSLMILKHYQFEGQGFKVDAAQLASHSTFLSKMLFDGDGHLGISKEGTLENLIIIEGCTSKAFANFLGWLNHKYINYNSYINYLVLI